MIKKEGGITLIALIITIIILVILAAVSIRAVYNMGIVGYAINGTQDYAKKAVEENQMLGETGKVIESALEKLNGINDKKMIKFYFGDEVYSGSSDIYGSTSGSVSGYTSGSVSGYTSGSVSGDTSGGGTSSNIELEVEEGTTWLEWANDRTKDTGNKLIDIIREYIRSLGANKTINGDYENDDGRYTIGLYYFDNNNKCYINTNDVIVENKTYEYWYVFTKLEKFRIFLGQGSNAPVVFEQRVNTLDTTFFDWIETYEPEGFDLGEGGILWNNNYLWNGELICSSENLLSDSDHFYIEEYRADYSNDAKMTIYNYTGNAVPILESSGITIKDENEQTIEITAFNQDGTVTVELETNKPYTISLTINGELVTIRFLKFGLL